MKSESVRCSRLSFRMLPIAAALALIALPVPSSFASGEPPSGGAPQAAVTPSADSWVQRSNANAQVLLELFARFAPEGAGHMGIPGLDEQIMDLKPGFVDRQKEALQQAIEVLEGRLEAEQDPNVRQDLEIMIGAAKRNQRGNELTRKYDLPYYQMSETVYHGLRGLLDDQVSAERRPAALVRLRRYAGEEKGYTPIAELAEAHIRERLAEPGLRGPVKDEVDKDLANSATYLDGIEKLFSQYRIQGYQKPLKKLRQQLAAYDDFVRREILPRARDDFRQPPELYAFALEQVGVDMPVEELQSRAKVAFKEIQNQLQMMAPLVAREKGWEASDYREVLRRLKQEQLVGEAVLPLYRKRVREIEEIIRRQGIVTLPARDMQIELASEAESASIPAPHMRPPRLIGNTGEKGTFVLPMRVPDATGKKQEFDDFSFEAASWTLIAHEGRPGHELQWSAVVERGVSLARAIFAINSVNVEGWALYGEAELQPYEPLEGQFVALQHRLLRAARAFLDPGLQLGTITRDQAFRVLTGDVVMSDPMAQQEVERYMWWAPGQATAYFVGYNRLMEIREDAERVLGRAFDRRRFNDFVLAQGMVTPTLLRQAVERDFVPSQMQKTAR